VFPKQASSAALNASILFLATSQTIARAVAFSFKRDDLLAQGRQWLVARQSIPQLETIFTDYLQQHPLGYGLFV